ncbi:Metallo-hydrolase/oxidoreductase [Epithele typhae]|uniref:Metallo-hydrolase/oxidoreductase n=1 Tax=Epithele typhae TaxID=378194 RepID=UPI0020080CA9|nr:Metallo-hydrolase/oxidoreductase [Epithele typhae]KAH9945245.1 Metallo-hydrolase/oxidoreductase [Epithele typhae]
MCKALFEPAAAPQSPPSTDDTARAPTSDGNKSAFAARRLTPSTFLIVEVDDVFDEHPFIYAKRVPAARTLVLLDTGCGGRTRRPDVELTPLRVFVETAPVADNGGRPLNARGAWAYVVVLSHCHYDHILGVDQFAHDSPVLVSAHDPTFLSPANLPTHSLCDSLGLESPSFTPSLTPDRAQLVSKDGVSLGLTLLHTPGHTPDELALWDEGDGMLYVGDTLYEDAHIIFPNEGSIVQWFASVDGLTAMLQKSGRAETAKINCGHKTAMGDAMEVLRTTKAFMRDVIDGKEKVKNKMTKRGEEHVEYVQDGGRYSLICPKRLVEEARVACL